MMNHLAKKTYGRLQTISLYGLGQIIFPLSQLIISFLITRYHSVDLWGGYVQNLIIVNLIILFASFGHRDFLMKEFSKQPDNMGKLWFKSLSTRSLIFLIGILFSLLLSAFTISNAIVLTWVSILFVASSFPVIILYQKDFKFQLYTEVVTGILLIGLVWFYIDQLTVSTIVILMSFSALLKFIVYVLKYWKLLRNASIALPSSENLKAHFYFFTPSAIGTLQSTSDLYIVAYLLGSGELGYYHIVIKLMGLGKMAGGYIITPFIKNFYRLSHNTLDKVIRKIMPWTFVFALLAALFMYFVLTYYFSLTLSMVDYMIIYLFFPAFFLYAPSLYYLFKIDWQRRVTGMVAFQMLLSITLGFVLVKNFNLTGGLAAATFSQWLTAFMFYAEFKKVRPVNL